MKSALKILSIIIFLLNSLAAKGIYFEKKYYLDAKNKNLIAIEAINCDIQASSKNISQIIVVIEQEELDKLDDNEIYESDNFIVAKMTKNCKKKILKITAPENFSFNITIKKGDVIFKGIFEKANIKIYQGGNISIDKFLNEVSAFTKGGNITFEKVGSNSAIKTCGGNISGIELGYNCEIYTEGGNINAYDSKGGTFITKGGNISINSIQGKLYALTYAGNISISNFKGSINLETKAGDINLGSGFGEAKIFSYGGDISAEKFEGNFYIKNSNGNVRIILASIENGALNAENSKVEIIAPENIKAKIKINLINSKLDSELLLKPSIEKNYYILNHGSEKHFLDVNLINSKLLISKLR